MTGPSTTGRVATRVKDFTMPCAYVLPCASSVTVRLRLTENSIAVDAVYCFVRASPRVTPVAVPRTVIAVMSHHQRRNAVSA